MVISPIMCQTIGNVCRRCFWTFKPIVFLQLYCFTLCWKTRPFIYNVAQYYPTKVKLNFASSAAINIYRPTGVYLYVYFINPIELTG